MERSRVGLAALLLLCACLPACQTLSVRSDFDREVDFSAYRSFSWLSPPLRETAERSEDPFAHNSLLDKRMRKVLDEELALRGLRPGAGDEADLRVDYHVVYSEKLVAHETRVGHFHHRWGPPFLSSVDVDVSQIPQVTLVVDLIDARSEQLVWRGWSTGRDRDRSLDEAQLRAAVAQILRRYPPPPPKSP